ncbi:LmbE-like protein [Anabaenopsis circularis NIES-21]|uniref:LmbE-like protein n=2 Tax=Nostocales TaxID=1161 RepID=A0A1Z4GFF2_9CYAN|nr:PIG-L family deacetylase [Nostoc cycadae]BAY16235.1 LmbE-like protein [Anabaenopsis circularis NIES-21]GBE92634.1 LmbE family protein [Nostoc cycadae WK-1]
MKIKTYLQQLQKLIPGVWLERMQYIHSSLLIRWILLQGSQQLTFNQKSAMVFSPHQDDETFGCGGMIARKCEQGIPVIVVFITNGQGSGNIDTESRKKIIQTRRQEAIKALNVLGVETSAIHFLDQVDGGLQELNLAEKQEAIAQISELLQHHQPEEVYVPHRKDCHRDHEATFHLVKAAIQQANIKVDLLQYPIWLFWRSPLFIMLKLSDIAAAYSFSITSVQQKKNQAIAAYTSQLASLPHGFVNRFLGAYEIFFKVES